jgi:hypothetical protein
VTLPITRGWEPPSTNVVTLADMDVTDVADGWAKATFKAVKCPICGLFSLGPCQRPECVAHRLVGRTALRWMQQERPEEFTRVVTKGLRKR